MILVPAIDILGGKVVRLKKGDYNQVTVYNDDPHAQARVFETAGVQRLHIVDLDGARDAAPTNIALISHIAQDTSLELEVGGGIRTMETLELYIEAGVNRVVLGSALVRDRGFARAAARLYADSVVAGIDAKDGMVAIEGWREGTSTPAIDLVRELQDLGIHELVYTDIARDGMRSGIDAAAYERLARAAGFAITASGGVATLADIEALGTCEPGCIDAVIAGRALYEGAFSVEEGIAACRAATKEVL